MAEDLIRYDILAQDALRGVVRKVLSEVARTGLPGDHHFFIGISTQAPGVRISSRLLAQYPEEMTIILQHQFWDLSVTEHGFEVGLSFNNVPERLLVPFTAVKSFLDPSVQFGLQFQIVGTPEAVTAEAPVDHAEAPVPLPVPPDPVVTATEADASNEELSEEAPNDAQVVSLDAFRKKQ
jgi:uncharacterized protein